MKITRQEYRIINEAMKKAYADISLYVTNRFEMENRGEPMNVAVDWYGSDSESADKAIEFAHQLITAAQVAQTLNRMDITVDFNAEDRIDKELRFEVIKKVTKEMAGGSLISVRRIGRNNGLN